MNEKSVENMNNVTFLLNYEDVHVSFYNGRNFYESVTKYNFTLLLLSGL